MVKLRVAASLFRVVSDPGMWQGNIAGLIWTIDNNSYRNEIYREIDMRRREITSPKHKMRCFPFAAVTISIRSTDLRNY